MGYTREEIEEREYNQEKFQELCAELEAFARRLSTMTKSWLYNTFEESKKEAKLNHWDWDFIKQYMFEKCRRSNGDIRKNYWRLKRYERKYGLIDEEKVKINYDLYQF